MVEYYDAELKSVFLKMLDPMNAKILEELGKHDPRNISFVAKSLGIPQTTVAYRIRKLTKRANLEMFAHLDYAKLGLRKAVAIMEALPGKWGLLWKAFKDFSYMTYLARYHGRVIGCYAVFAFPANHKEKLKELLDEAARLRIFSHYLFFWITDLCRVSPQFIWLDFKEKKWIFRWQQWIDEISNASENLSSSLLDPQEYPVMVDEKDLVILREVEQNAIVNFNKLAKTLGISPSSVGERYHKHLVNPKIIVDHFIGASRFPFESSDYCSFIINFRDQKSLAKFTNSLNDKPFMLSYAKVVGRHSIVAHTHIPKTEFPNLLESLDRLAEMNLVKDFFYATLIRKPYVDNPLPCELFGDGTWHYDQKENIERLRKLIGMG